MLSKMTFAGYRTRGTNFPETTTPEQDKRILNAIFDDKTGTFEKQEPNYRGEKTYTKVLKNGIETPDISIPSDSYCTRYENTNTVVIHSGSDSFAIEKPLSKSSDK